MSHFNHLILIAAFLSPEISLVAMVCIFSSIAIDQGSTNYHHSLLFLYGLWANNGFYIFKGVCIAEPCSNYME